MVVGSAVHNVLFLSLMRIIFKNAKEKIQEKMRTRKRVVIFGGFFFNFELLLFLFLLNLG